MITEILQGLENFLKNDSNKQDVVNKIKNCNGLGRIIDLQEHSLPCISEKAQMINDFHINPLLNSTLRVKCYNEFLLSLTRVLGGRFEEYNMMCKDGTTTSSYVSSYQLRVFVSSTFTDTHLERNIISVSYTHLTLPTIYSV